MIKLRDYANKYNITYKTAWNHWKNGYLNGKQLKSGTIFINDEDDEIKNDKLNNDDYIITYARVSSSENKSNLIEQSKRLNQYCNANGWIINESIKEIGSGLNDNRCKLNKILNSNQITKLVVEHKDRLTRFGFNYIKILCERNNIELIIINNTENDKEDLIQDFVSVITSFCARIYGQRRTKRKTEKLINEIKKDETKI